MELKFNLKTTFPQHFGVALLSKTQVVFCTNGLIERDLLHSIKLDRKSKFNLTIVKRGVFRAVFFECM